MKKLIVFCAIALSSLSLLAEEAKVCVIHNLNYISEVVTKYRDDYTVMIGDVEFTAIKVDPTEMTITFVPSLTFKKSRFDLFINKIFLSHDDVSEDMKKLLNEETKNINFKLYPDGQICEITEFDKSVLKAKKFIKKEFDNFMLKAKQVKEDISNKF